MPTKHPVEIDGLTGKVIGSPPIFLGVCKDQQLIDRIAMQTQTLAQEIIETIGHEAAIKMFEVYGGMRIYVPKNISDINKIRNQKIRSERLAGASPQQLSEKYKINIRRIFFICKKPF
jgi:Mor family transcriptional regulator